MNGDIDHKLQKLASTNWGKFSEIAGEEFVLIIKARLLKQEGKSWKQISMTLNISISKARTACKKMAANF